MSPPLHGWLRRQGVDATFQVLANLVHPAVVFVVDGERNILFWSDDAEKLLGFSAAEVIGSHCLKGIRCPRCMTGCGLSERGSVTDVPVVLHRADGAAVHFRKTARAFYDADGRFAGGIEVLLPDPGAGDTPAMRAPEGARSFHGLVSRDPVMHRAFDTIRNVAETEATVLVRGESGSGKELVARAIHDESHRAKGPFVAVNCAALSPGLLESELFGHVRGAFTGAVSDREGIFAQAHGGTLFLDEVAELPLEVQAKLLRVLQDRTITPVGSTKARAVDVRLVAATHRALREEVRTGRFREDLMFRLRVVPLFLPPLRERRGDIELLLFHFIQRYNERGPRNVRGVNPDAMRRLLDHSWPGNVRELQNAVEYAFAVGRGPEITLDELPPEFREPPRLAVGIRGPTPADEAAAVKDALDRAAGNVGRAAELLGVSRPTFWRWRKKAGL